MIVLFSVILGSLPPQRISQLFTIAKQCLEQAEVLHEKSVKENRRLIGKPPLVSSVSLPSVPLPSPPLPGGRGRSGCHQTDAMPLRSSSVVSPLLSNDQVQDKQLSLIDWHRFLYCIYSLVLFVSKTCISCLPSVYLRQVFVFFLEIIWQCLFPCGASHQCQCQVRQAFIAFWWPGARGILNSVCF